MSVKEAMSFCLLGPDSDGATVPIATVVGKHYHTLPPPIFECFKKGPTGIEVRLNLELKEGRWTSTLNETDWCTFTCAASASAKPSEDQHDGPSYYDQFHNALHPSGAKSAIAASVYVADKKQVEMYVTTTSLKNQKDAVRFYWKYLLERPIIPPSKSPQNGRSIFKADFKTGPDSKKK
jgi:hypothetical protein